MLCVFECLLLVTFAYVVPVRSYPYEKTFARSDTDWSEKIWRASSQKGSSSNERRLNEHVRDEHSNADDDEIGRNRKSKSEASYDKDDQSTNKHHGENGRKRDEKKGADHSENAMERGEDEMKGSKNSKSETRHDKYDQSTNESHRENGRTQDEKKGGDRAEDGMERGENEMEGKAGHENDKHSREYSNQTGSAEHYMEKDEGKAEGSRGKNCHGADAKDERPRNLRGHSEQEIEPVSECEEEDNGLGLPVILGIVGAVLVGVFAFGAIFFACSRRRTATKAVLGAGGVVVMGQPVSASTPNDGTNKKGNAPEELAHDNA